MNRISLLLLLLCLSWSIRAQAQVVNNSVIQVGATPSGSCTQGEPARQIPSGSGGTIYDCVAGSWSARGGGGGSAAGSSGDYQINNGGSFGAGVLAQSAGRLTATPTAASSGVASYFRVITPADTTLTASTESIGAQFGGNTSAATVTRQWAAGALATQRENLFVAPTYAFAVASTLTTAATVAITGAPAAGTNAIIANPLALWVQSGNSWFTPTVSESPSTIRVNASAGTPVVQIGTYPGIPSYAGGWFGNVTPTTSNYAFIGNGSSELIFNVPNAGGTIFFRANTSNILTATSTLVQLPSAIGDERLNIYGTGSGNSAGFGIKNGIISIYLPGSSNRFGFYDQSTSGTELFTITGTGPIGVNKSSSIAAQLHIVSGSASRVGLRVDSASSPSVAIADFTNNGTSRVKIENDSTITLSGVAFSALGSTNGVLAYCSDCAVTSGADNTCAGSGTGALAMRLNGVWRCFIAQN